MISSRVQAIPLRIFLGLLTVGMFAGCKAQLSQPQTPPSPSQTEEAARADILARVRAHIFLPEEPKPTVAEILDVDTLRARNAFYKNAANGDYLIVTPTRAILYSPSKDMILDVMPVQLERTPPVEAPQMQE